jgi:hypothetical protein
VRYWQTFGTLKWGVICESMADAWLSGHERVAEKLAVGRRASEAEIDLLELLVPRMAVRAQPDGAPSAAAPQADCDARPSAAELLHAAAEHLRGHTLPALRGAAAFQTRVVAGMVEIARRESELGAAARDRELQGLRRLSGRTAAGLDELRRWLCDAIATGRCSPDTPGLTEHLWRTTLDRLSIDQPDYGTYSRHRGAGAAADARG